MYRTEIKLQTAFVYRLAIVCLSAVCLFTLTTNAIAAAGSNETQDTYVDSVYSWGIWELDIEPASGPQAPANNAMNNRALNLKFRPNDNAAYTTVSIPVPPVTNITPPAPPAPPTIPIVGLDGSGPIIPGAIPTAPNRRR